MTFSLPCVEFLLFHTSFRQIRHDTVHVGTSSVWRYSCPRLLSGEAVVVFDAFIVAGTVPTPHLLEHHEKAEGSYHQQPCEPNLLVFVGKWEG